MTVTRHTAAVFGNALSLIITFIVVASNAPPALLQNDWTAAFPPSELPEISTTWEAKG